MVFKEKKTEEHYIRISGHVEKSVASATCIQNGIRQSYDAEFNLVVITCIEKTNTYNAARKFTAAGANIQRWKEQKQKYIDANSIQKSSSDSNHGCFQ